MLLYRRMKYGYAFRRIKLTRGKYAIVDARDYGRLSRYKWSASWSGKNWYALRREWHKGKKRNERCVYMQREIIDVPAGMVADHINHTTLDNRRANLRAATFAQNMWNRKKSRKARCKSQYKGVCRSSDQKRWRAEISYNSKIMRLGNFADEKEAAKAYDAAARRYHGEFAVLNFAKDR